MACEELKMVLKTREIHKDCSKKCQNLSSELKLAKAQLEKLRISCGRTLCNQDGTQDLSCSPLPTSPKLGNCSCPGKPGPPSQDMYVTEMMNQFNGAQRHDPQMLLDHIKQDHPHLVKRVPPKLPLSALKKGNNDQGESDQEDNAGACIGKMGCGLGSRSRSPSSTRSQKQSIKGKRKMVHKQTSSSKKQKGGSLHEAKSTLKHSAVGGATLMPTQRYNFYRYFGYAGQGAKTSKDWYSIKNPWIQTVVSP